MICQWGFSCSFACHIDHILIEIFFVCFKPGLYFGFYFSCFHQLAEQEVELYNQRNTQRKLAGLEMAYQKATQMIDALKNDKSDTITQLEETFAAQSMAKELIIGNLQKKIEDLKQTLAIDEQSETIQHLHNSDRLVFVF